jgi:hypothetical protein
MKAIGPEEGSSLVWGRSRYGDMAGLLLFLAGLGLSGWLHSKAVGTVTSVVAVVTALAVFWFARVLP